MGKLYDDVETLYSLIQRFPEDCVDGRSESYLFHLSVLRCNANKKKIRLCKRRLGSLRNSPTLPRCRVGSMQSSDRHEDVYNHCISGMGSMSVVASPVYRLMARGAWFHDFQKHIQSQKMVHRSVILIGASDFILSHSRIGKGKEIGS